MRGRSEGRCKGWSEGKGLSEGSEGRSEGEGRVGRSEGEEWSGEGASGEKGEGGYVTMRTG